MGHSWVPRLSTSLFECHGYTTRDSSCDQKFWVLRRLCKAIQHGHHGLSMIMEFTVFIFKAIDLYIYI